LKRAGIPARMVSTALITSLLNWFFGLPRAWRRGGGPNRMLPRTAKTNDEQDSRF